MKRTLNRNRWRQITLACAVSALAVGCAANEAQNPPSTAPVSSSPVATPTQTEDPKETAKKEATATYLAHWREMEKLYADRTGKAANLKQYAASAALSQAELDAKSLHQRNLLIVGSVTVNNPTATNTDINRKIPHVILSSCLDISRWQTVDAGTKKPATMPANRLTRYLIKTTVERWPEGWRVIRDEPQGKKC
ncbi:hypothetical protein [Streptomyces sp. NPDC054975]